MDFICEAHLPDVYSYKIKKEITVLPEKNKYDVLYNWFNTAQGCRVVEALCQELKFVANHVSGRRILQLGACGDNDKLDVLRFRQRYIVSESLNIKKVSTYANFTNLPIERNSIDCVLAPFTMETYASNASLIDEIDRIINPHGFVIVFGINPCSFWGLSAILRLNSGFTKESSYLRNSLTVKHAFLNRGYRQCLLHSFFYIPPFKNKKVIYSLDFLNEMGKMIWPYPASFYCFVAQKYDPCLPFVDGGQDEVSIADATF
ncbi:MAG: hypothetical protein A3E88_01360 [Legionellales bacterium RIFCSPHIGHO2_12_FULL_35_11]|nr:MAG: hypothetical protein A3E88_01360 [Legionellales bacterium RIFCSPHIGHO2_12_FULL_35_11]